MKGGGARRGGIPSSSLHMGSQYGGSGASSATGTGGSVAPNNRISTGASAGGSGTAAVGIATGAAPPRFAGGGSTAGSIPASTAGAGRAGCDARGASRVSAGGREGGGSTSGRGSVAAARGGVAESAGASAGGEASPAKTAAEGRERAGGGKHPQREGGCFSEESTPGSGTTNKDGKSAIRQEATAVTGQQEVLHARNRWGRGGELSSSMGGETEPVPGATGGGGGGGGGGGTLGSAVGSHNSSGISAGITPPISGGRGPIESNTSNESFINSSNEGYSSVSSSSGGGGGSVPHYAPSGAVPAPGSGGVVGGGGASSRDAWSSLRNKMCLEEMLYETSQRAKVYNRNHYGLLGILKVIRMTDPDLNVLALGTDLTSLGLNLNSTESLLPSCYIAPVPPVFKLSHLEKLTDTTLLYIFYCCPRVLLQGCAAAELYNRSWKYHTLWKKWFILQAAEQASGEGASTCTTRNNGGQTAGQSSRSSSATGNTKSNTATAEGRSPEGDSSSGCDEATGISSQETSFRETPASTLGVKRHASAATSHTGATGISDGNNAVSGNTNTRSSATSDSNTNIGSSSAYQADGTTTHASAETSGCADGGGGNMPSWIYFEPATWSRRVFKGILAQQYFLPADKIRASVEEGIRQVHAQQQLQQQQAQHLNVQHQQQMQQQQQHFAQPPTQQQRQPQNIAAHPYVLPSGSTEWTAGQGGSSGR